MKTNTILGRLWVAAALLWAADAAAIVLTFQRDVALTDFGIWPFNYGDRVTALSYNPPNYSPPAYTGPRPTWHYGASGGFTPNIVAEFRTTKDVDTEVPPRSTTGGPYGDLYQVFAGTGETFGCIPQYIAVTLTADPGYKVHLSSFDIANVVGPRPLQHLQVTRGNGAVLLAASAVPIDGGPGGTHTIFNNSGAGWTGQSLMIRLDASFDLAPVDFFEAQTRHISRFGLDNIVFSQVADTRIEDVAPVPDAISDRAPILATTPEDTSVNIVVLSAPLPASSGFSFTQGANGTVTQNPDGALLYTPNLNFNGSDSFSYTITGCASIAVGAVVVSVTPVNDDPTAVGDAVTIDEDTSVTLNVLANDTDLDGDALSVQAVTQGVHGLVVLNPDGSATYQPEPDFNGGDAFTYTVSDGHGGTATATATVTVAPVNDPPLAVGDAVVTLEDTSVNIPVLANDSDSNEDTLTLAAFTQGANGTVTLNPDGTLNYTPNLNCHGADTFTYSVSDGVLTTVGTVAVSIAPVNDAPNAGSDSAATDEDTPVTLNLLANDSDVDGDALFVESVTPGVHGSVILNPDSSVTYVPELNFNGSDVFTYTVSDGQGGATTASVRVTVLPVNDPPVASNGTATGPEEMAIEIVLQATDADGDALSFAIVTQPLHGTVSSLDNNRVTYTPAVNFSGEDSLTFSASDGQATANAVVRLTIGPVNDPPVFGPVTDWIVNEETALSFQLTATDTEGDTLTFSSANLPPGAELNPTTGEFHWTPNFAQAGTYPVMFTVADPSGGMDSATMTIHVVDVPQNANQDPDCSRAVPSVGEIWPPNHKQGVVIDILGVTDPDGDAVTITITKMLQDEPTNTLGDGSTWVDGGGVGTPRAWVRAERSGTPRVPGNGRVYEIFFTASDGHGGTCSSSVKVSVPHDQDHRPAIDDGVRYDSTVPGGPRVY